MGNGDYNQALSANSALIEIGGVENNLEENYRTITLLAKVMREIWLEDNKLY
ncbi:stage II sporulation protein P [Mycobacterium tuberculosis]|uniref:stage II sporulation protein P n=1 Tax=Mycobacterium tuberculosis TaxID=1773 RepID=UPI0034D305C1